MSRIDPDKALAFVAQLRAEKASLEAAYPELAKKGLPTMADYRDGLHKVPSHMWEAIEWWIEKGEPHPRTMGDFMRAVLLDELVESFARADHLNIRCMRGWAEFLHGYAPIGSWGSAEALEHWYAAHHPQKSEAADGGDEPKRTESDDDIP